MVSGIEEPELFFSLQVSSSIYSLVHPV